MEEVRQGKEEEARQSGRRGKGRREDARQSGHICQQFVVEFGRVSLNTDAVMGEASRDTCSSSCRLAKMGRRDLMEEVKNEVVDTLSEYEMRRHPFSVYLYCT